MAKATPAKPAKKSTPKKAAVPKAANEVAKPPKKSASKKPPETLPAEEEWRAQEAILRHEIESLKRDLLTARDEVLSRNRVLIERGAEMETLRHSYDEALAELKLAQTQLSARVDEGWSTEAAVSAELQEAREAEKHAVQAADAARAEARVLKAELDRLRGQLAEKPRSGATLPGIAPVDPKKPPEKLDAKHKVEAAQKVPHADKAAAADETTKNELPPDENKPGFWGSLFKRKKNEE